MTEPMAELISAYLYGHITAEQYEPLRAWLAADPRHMQEYIREAYLHHATRLALQRREARMMHAGAEGEANRTAAAELFRRAVENDRKLLEESKGRLSPQEIRELADRKLAEFLKEQRRQELRERREADLERRRWRRSLLAAAGVWAGVGNRAARLAVVGASVVLAAAAVYYAWEHPGWKDFLNPVVANVADTLEARWDVGIEKHAALHKGRYKLEQGYARLTFHKGASVSIEAPAEFRLDSAGRMVLFSGRLFADVPPSARGFRVDTPHARIVDLGTQFGVTTDANTVSDLHLFKGKASLTPGTAAHAGATRLLTEGQARSVDRVATVTDIHLQEGGFVRHFCSQTRFVWRGEKLSLADLAAGGDGLGTGPGNVFVNPATGYTDASYGVEKGNTYHRLPASRFVDGLFVPNGDTPQVVSSRGHVFADCPATNGECYASLGINPLQRVWATNVRTGSVRFNDQDYGAHDHPCLMMHANLGVTFDLNAVRALCPDLRITRFVSQTAIADFNEVAECNADFWVLVDGQVRHAQRRVTRKAVLADVSVELGPADRFLTLVTTDGGDVDRLGAYQRSYTCDWCVFIEPALQLASD